MHSPVAQMPTTGPETRASWDGSPPQVKVCIWLVRHAGYQVVKGLSTGANYVYRDACRELGEESFVGRNDNVGGLSEVMDHKLAQAAIAFTQHGSGLRLGRGTQKAAGNAQNTECGQPGDHRPIKTGGRQSVLTAFMADFQALACQSVGYDRGLWDDNLGPSDRRTKARPSIAVGRPGAGSQDRHYHWRGTTMFCTVKVAALMVCFLSVMMIVMFCPANSLTSD